MDLNLFFNGLSIPDKTSQLFEKNNLSFEQFVKMLSHLLAKDLHLNITIQTDIKNKLCDIIVPYNRKQTEHHFWKLFLDHSKDIMWSENTLSTIFNKSCRFYIEVDNSMDAMMLFGAAIEKLIAISFNINECFNSHVISLVKENGNEMTKLEINNMSSVETAILAIREFASRLSPSDEIYLFQIMYPHLLICDRAKSDYIEWNTDLLFKKQTKNILDGLNKCVQESNNKKMNVRNYCPNVSPDTAHSINSDHGERTVRCPDGKDFIFSYHVKSNAARVYYDTRYIPDRHILIGRLLPISQHP